jgi:hypothetical protein
MREVMARAQRRMLRRAGVEELRAEEVAACFRRCRMRFAVRKSFRRITAPNARGFLSHTGNSPPGSSVREEVIDND